jgi:aminoglycoside 6'-N-acetyltransferase I
MKGITIRRVLPEDKAEWLRMRLSLWPDASPDKHLAEMNEIIPGPMQPVFVVVRSNGQLGGYLEVGTRKYAEGCESSPVGYIKGWFVNEDLRGQGVGRALMHAVEEWAREQGLTEIASDTWLDNEASIQAHLKLGYEEVERTVNFAKKLD